MALLEIQNLSFSYDSSTPILSNLEFSVEEGELFLLCGPCACGKTTLLRLVKHLIAPRGKRTGNIRLNGEDVATLDQSVLTSQIGYVFQSPQDQLVCDTPLAELAFGLENLGVPSNVIHQRIAEMCGFLGITPFLSLPSHALSGGQKQLLALASVLLMQPRLLLLDEPISMLDPIAAGHFTQILERVNRQLGITIILCEHDLELFYPQADRIAVMDGGKLAALGSPSHCAHWMLDHHHPCSASLPTSSLLYDALNRKDKGAKGNSKYPVPADHPREEYDTSSIQEIPLSIRDGQKYVREHFSNYPSFCTADQTAPAPSPETLCFSMKHLCFRYEKGQPDVLHELDFSGHPGEIISLVGANGSGKSTLLSVLSGYRKPQWGKLRVPRAGLLPQNAIDLFQCDCVGKEFQSFHKENWLSLHYPQFWSFIQDCMEDNPLDLSGGQLQAVGLARLILEDYDLYLLDEPARSLDGRWKQDFFHMIQDLAEKGKTIVLSTHDLNLAASLSHQVAMMFQGEITVLTDPHEFFENNAFYTTGIRLMTRGILPACITLEDVVAAEKRREQ